MSACYKCNRKIYPGFAMWNVYSCKRGWAHRICPKRRGRKKRPFIHARNRQETLAMGYKHPRSRKEPDGREVLFDIDYKMRVREVEERDEYKCKWPRDGKLLPTGFEPMNPRAFFCNAPSNGKPHHIVKRSDGRDDRAENLMAICDMHHKIAHPEKQLRNPKVSAANG